MSKRYLWTLGVVVLIGVLSTTAWAVPPFVTYQGKLTDTVTGTPITDPGLAMTFRIYDAATAGTLLWEEEHASVPVDNGIYTILLGSGTTTSGSFDPDLFSEDNRWLEVEVDGEIFDPMQQITSVAFSMKAGVAEAVEGGAITTVMIADGAVETDKLANDAISGAKIASDQVTSAHLVTGAVGTDEIDDGSVSSTDVGFYYAGSTSKGGPATDLACVGCVSQSEIQVPLSLSGSASWSLISGYNEAADGTGVYGESSYYGVWGYSTGNAYAGVHGTSSNGYGVRGYSTNNYGVYGVNANTGNYGYLGGSKYGVYGLNESSESWSAGVYGEDSGTSGIGVMGYANNWSGTSTTGGFFQADGITGKGVQGIASQTGSNVENYGGYFRAWGTLGKGVYGTSLDTGVHGVGTANYHGKGVYAEATGFEGIGLYAIATGTGGKGVYAKGGANGYAGEFQGKVLITSTATGDPVMELGEGLDYAEGFNVSKGAKIKPGDVLIIDPDNSGKLMLSKMPYDTRVAGIVAGAKGLGSGVRLGGEQFDQDVALAGRVYCNVDATEAGVEPGDLLTTSGTPGYAMKSTDYGRAQGAILGKAMQKLERGQKGQILVLVTLQ
jgi:hypothetical protein